MALQHSLLRFKFSGFEDLDLDDKRFADQTLTDCKGHKISVEMAFKDLGDGDDSWVSFCLYPCADDDEIVQVSFVMRDAAGRVVHEDDSCTCALRALQRSPRNPEFIRRSVVVDESNNILQSDGSLVFEVDIQYKPKQSNLFMAPNPLAKNLLRFLDSGKGADVTFNVQGEEIMAHKLIIDAGSPFLASLCEGVPDSDADEIHIQETTPEAFRHVLRYIYGETTPDKEKVLGLWKEIIIAADRYCIDGLKMLVETIVVHGCIIDTKNVADYILFADAKTCPLIKEYCTSYFVARARDILDSPSSDKLQESAKLMKELMVAVLHKSDGRAQTFEDEGNNSLTVDALRKMLSEKGLDVDGSKEILVSRLEDSYGLECANKRQRVE